MPGSCLIRQLAPARRYYAQQRRQQGVFFKHLGLTQEQAGGRGSDVAPMQLAAEGGPACMHSSCIALVQHLPVNHPAARSGKLHDQSAHLCTAPAQRAPSPPALPADAGAAPQRKHPTLKAAVRKGVMLRHLVGMADASKVGGCCRRRQGMHCSCASRERARCCLASVPAPLSCDHPLPVHPLSALPAGGGVGTRAH